MSTLLDRIKALRALGFGLGFNRNSNQPGETVSLDTALKVDLTIQPEDLGHPMARELALDHLATEMVKLLRETADNLETNSGIMDVTEVPHPELPGALDDDTLCGDPCPICYSPNWDNKNCRCGA